MSQFERDTPHGGGRKTGGSLSICIDIYDTYTLSILTFHLRNAVFQNIIITQYGVAEKEPGCVYTSRLKKIIQEKTFRVLRLCQQPSFLSGVGKA